MPGVDGAARTGRADVAGRAQGDLVGERIGEDAFDISTARDAWLVVDALTDLVEWINVDARVDVREVVDHIHQRIARTRLRRSTGRDLGRVGPVRVRRL
ncbi:hypothetical protein [Phytoactinopolyspora halotolerans]|uniref:Uncharacterized protein n=1 Tax=Phytoactinopolyspora halotolerans TaxID=1981512 RepID=A0A6L9S9G6_9ACTN|nr:hypothetical protein [Phytoactinopolyspora halotolerans]NEE01158.1 hypothetical protein [Phytoactinopolyspora halotolerans]